MKPIQFKNYKETQELLSVSEYLAIYREWVAQGLERGELSSKVHNLLINLSNVYLNWDFSEPILTDKHNRKYQPEMDKWALAEFDKVKSVLAELRKMNVPEFQPSLCETETEFLAFLKMECDLRYRPLLAHSWRVGQR
jgi:hypothetical protein